MDQILQGSTGTLTATFTNAAGVPADPTPNPAPPSVSVGVTDDAGTTVVPVGTEATMVSTGVYSLVLTPELTTTLDRLTARWTSGDGTLVTRAEIVGGFVMQVGDVMAATGLDEIAATRLRESVEGALEDACGVAFVPRYSLERQRVGRGGRARLDWGEARRLRSVTIDGTPWTQAQVDAVAECVGERWVGLGREWRGWWARIGYEHGMDQPPRFVVDAAMSLAVYAAGVGSGTVDPRAVSIVTLDGTLSLSRGADGSFGLPDVDRAVSRLAGGAAEVW